MLQQVQNRQESLAFENSGQLIHFLKDAHADIHQLITTVRTEKLNWALARHAGVEVWVRRDDAIDPVLSGNKLYKLFGFLREYQARDLSGLPLLSFGGAYSNHLHALAALGQMLGIATVGIIRGEPGANLSPTLIDLQSRGMRLHFVSRTHYRLRSQPSYIAGLLSALGLDTRTLVVPEGGDAELGERGLFALGQYLAGSPWHAIYCACGTGTTLRGLALGMLNSKHTVLPSLYGVSALKSNDSIYASIQASFSGDSRLNWGLTNQYHGGGFAKLTKHLLGFKQDFEQETGLELDRVYTLKLFSALAAQLRAGFIARGQKIVVIHSGGLQGNRSLS